LTDREWRNEPALADDGSYPLSASAIKKYRTCPEQYRFSYLSDKTPTKASKGYLSLGSAVHEAIERVLKDDSPLYEDRLERDLKREYRNGDEQPPDDMFDDGIEYLEVAARFLSAMEPEIVGVEVDSEFGLSRPDIDSRFRGIMDVATGGEIWDWKTGRIRDDTPVEEKIQGAVYMKCFEKEYGKPPEGIRFVYLKEEKQRKLETSDEIWDEMLGYARDVVEGKKNDEYPPDPADGDCFWCAYESHCHASPVGAGGIDYIKF